jgi:hypothetical protein
LGEEIINKLLKDKNNPIYNSIPNIKWNWANETHESYLPYDFSFNETHFLEVKASSKKDSGFFLSSNEILMFKRYFNKYWLIKVNGVDLQSKKFSTITIYNSIELQQLKYDEIINRKYKEDWND